MPDHIKLSELAREIESVVTNNFNDKSYYVIGETIGVRNKTDIKQCYLRLIEKNQESQIITTEIDATIWGSSYNSIASFERDTGEQFKDNIQVLVKVKVVYHPKHGLKLNILEIDTQFTLGNLEIAKRNTLKKLLEENADKIKFENGRYITFNNTLTFGFVIQDIALVASIGTDGHNDFIKQLVNNQRSYKFNIDPYDTPIQGKNAEVRIKEKLLQIFNSKKKYDAVVIVRGGGSLVDFHTFNDYDLCRVVARFPLPIITGIGHARNEAIIDIMAKEQTNAPTQAATFILHHNRKFEESVLELQKTIIVKSQQNLAKYLALINSINSVVVNKTRNLLTKYTEALIRFTQVTINRPQAIIFERRSKLNALSNVLISKPQITTSNKLNDLKNLTQNIQSDVLKLIKNQKGYLGHFDAITKASDLNNILKKGFAVLYYNGKIISKADTLKSNDEIKIRILNSEIKSLVKSKTEVDGNKPIL
jgi:exodeoxyribonuclease VII large subunit